MPPDFGRGTSRRSHGNAKVRPFRREAFRFCQGRQFVSPRAEGGSDIVDDVGFACDCLECVLQ